jgi:hypothetical protein
LIGYLDRPALGTSLRRQAMGRSKGSQGNAQCQGHPSLAILTLGVEAPTLDATVWSQTEDVVVNGL